MQDDHVRYWQGLTENYRRMSDGELLELSAKPEDLTEVARQVLRDEMSTRKLEKGQPARDSAPINSVPRRNYDLLAGPLADSYVVPTESEDNENGEGAPDEFTWKTMLCECSDVQEAKKLSEALRRAGIQSWIEAMPSYAIGTGTPRVLVAADQFEEARAIAAQPLPPDIMAEAAIEVPEFAPPLCPKCGAHDPVLESVDPVNAWVCEICGAEWTDPEAATMEDESQ